MAESQESHLLALAPELTQIISDELDLASVGHLRLACKHLAELLNSRVFRALTIDITKNTIERSLAKIVTLATSDHAARQATRDLSILSLSPAFSPEYRGPQWNHVDGQWIAEPEPQAPPEVALAEEEMKLHLFQAITSLKGVQSVHWVPRSMDNQWAHSTVMDALKSLPNLREFWVSLPSIKTPVAWEHLKGLRQIHIEGTCDEHEDETFDSLAKAVAQSPQLTSIEIASGWRYRLPTNKKQSLHQIFKYYPRDATPLRLRHLQLMTWLVRLDEVTLPHLKHLTSLELVNIEDPYARSPYTLAESDDESEAKHENRRYGSSVEEIWKTMRSARIRLEELTVDVVTPSFLDYLSSYSGLKMLHITPGGFHEGTSSDALAKKFFADPLQKHSGSLEDLNIAARYEGLWCFSDHNLPAIAKCTNLKSLRIAIISSQLWNDDDHAKAAPNSDAIKLLIDTALVHLPHLKKFQIVAANLETLRHARCGNPAMSHFSRAGKMMVRSVLNYTAPPSCRRLPTLKVGTGRSFRGRPIQVFTAGSDGHDLEGGPLRYIDSSPPTEGRDEFNW
ncbi:hypothetical protein GALMADRAFT_101133 [Galerina marginata CBS 339.88]|uniref:F-box domain-containing protein n=1 Tax=Galerina marginata (strain CBS 339.88) TaxID=685588 RepID=A0A067SPC8_GALM3|nr:hypothetical protein GALMADRAFT_101133 [Galerina marginata CBS 339.88]